MVVWSFLILARISGTFDVATGSLMTMNESITNPSGVSGQWYGLSLYSGSGFGFLKLLESEAFSGDPTSDGMLRGIDSELVSDIRGLRS